MDFIVDVQKAGTTNCVRKRIGLSADGGAECLLLEGSLAWYSATAIPKEEANTPPTLTQMRGHASLQYSSDWKHSYH
jgi:hypothetical protein